MTTNDTRTTADRLAAVMRRASTPTLIATALNLYAADSIDEHERRAMVWTVDEIERRHPELLPIVDRYLDDESPRTRNYAELLRDAAREARVTR